MKILPFIITEHQLALAKNRLIPDNTLVAFESLHCMKNLSTGNTSYMAVKLDIIKACDCMEWVYLENITRKMGFSEKWIGLIMVCIKIMTYSVLVNDEPHGLIHPTRGIRQGDCLPFTSYYAQKDYMDKFNKLQEWGILKVSLFVREVLN